MGFPFPIGMILFGEGNKAWFWGEGNKAWFWAVNGVSSVLGSVSSVVLAMTIGLAEVFILGTAFYLLAILVFRGAVQPQ